MKKIAFDFSYLLIVCFICSVTFVSCKSEEKEALYPNTEITQTPEQLGQEVFDGKGTCYTCHKEDQKVIGPSLNEIAKLYKAKGGNMVEFLQGKADPIVDPSQFEVMKTNFSITKNLPEEELKALEAYILSHSK
ncbi:c-type cytochrome [Flavobacterium sp.]|uniref:c-type cytochrome n=1 Tax=Flavobacterium sp. TaxID=239 RepID=UPI002612C3ED|nr:c-type cytochrome [Flavobacterium sp.]